MPQCLEVNPFNYAIIQFRRLFHTVMWLFDYWKNIIDFVLRFQFLLYLSTNCFSVVPLQLKMQSTLVLVTLPMKKLCLYLSLYSPLYTITVVVLFLVVLLAKHTYLGVIHCCTWNDHWAQIPLFFSSTTTPSPQYHTRCLSDLLITWQNLTTTIKLKRYCIVHVAWVLAFIFSSNFLTLFQRLDLFSPFVLLTTTKNNTIKELEEGNSTQPNSV